MIIELIRGHQLCHNKKIIMLWLVSYMKLPREQIALIQLRLQSKFENGNITIKYA